MKLVIDRKTWLRGEGSAESYLLRGGDNKMCCLGHFAVGLGAVPGGIRNAQVPNAAYDACEWPTWLLPETYKTSQAGAALMKINDHVLGYARSGWYREESVYAGWLPPDPPKTEPERESMIAEIFAKHGVEVEFVN